MIWQTKPTLLALSLVLLSGCAGTLNPQQREQAPSDMATWFSTKYTCSRSAMAANVRKPLH